MFFFYLFVPFWGRWYILSPLNLYSDSTCNDDTKLENYFWSRSSVTHAMERSLMAVRRQKHIEADGSQRTGLPSLPSSLLFSYKMLTKQEVIPKLINVNFNAKLKLVCLWHFLLLFCFPACPGDLVFGFVMLSGCINSFSCQMRKFVISLNQKVTWAVLFCLFKIYLIKYTKSSTIFCYNFPEFPLPPMNNFKHLKLSCIW